MTTVQTLQRRLVVFSVLAGVLVVALVLRSGETSAVRVADMPLVFPDFATDKARARTIELTQAEPGKEAAAKVVRLERKTDPAWTLASSFGYAAKDSAVQSFLDAVATARRSGESTQRSETFADYAQPGGWIHAVVKDAGGKVLADFHVGKYARYPETYLRVTEGGKERVVRAVDFTTNVARMTTEAWAESRVWGDVQASDVTRIDVEQRKFGRTISLVKETPAPAPPGGDKDAPKGPAEPEWKMVSPTEGKANRLDAEDLVRAFTGMLFEDVVAGKTTPEQEAEFGLVEPELVVTVTGTAREPGKDAPKHSIAIGGKVKDKESHYLRRQGDAFVLTVAAYALERLRKEPESLLPPKEPKEGEGKDGEKKDGEKDGEKKDGEEPPASPGSPDGEPVKEPPKEPEPPKPPDAPK